jgi:hypothetical protein
MSEQPDTEELKCLALIEVMAIPQERREIALGTLRAIKERDEARKDAQKSKAYKKVLKETNARLRGTIVGWENKWRCAVEMAARAELERDEALKCAKEYYVEFIRNASSDNKVSKPNPLNPFYKY